MKKKNLDYSNLLKENKEFGIVWERGCGRERERTKKTIKTQTKRWNKADLLELIRFIVLNTERESITRELFSIELKAKLGLVHDCFAKLEIEGLIVKDNYIMHDENISYLPQKTKKGFITTGYKRSKSWWNATIYKIRRKNEKV